MNIMLTIQSRDIIMICSKYQIVQFAFGLFVEWKGVRHDLLD